MIEVSFLSLSDHENPRVCSWHDQKSDIFFPFRDNWAGFLRRTGGQYYCFLMKLYDGGLRASQSTATKTLTNPGKTKSSGVS